MSVKMVPANLLDLGVLLQLDKICFGDDAWTMLDFLGVLTQSKMIRLKMMSGDQLIGFVAAEADLALNEISILTLGILPEFRRQGLGSMLLSTCEKSFKCTKIKLCVRVDNGPAIRLYQNHGYQIVDVWEKYYAHQADAFVMEKIL